MSEIVDLNMSDIVADSTFNCRGEIRPIDCLDLAKDIKANGLLQPIIVRKNGEKYKVVAGHRRHMAFKINEAKTIPCIIAEMTEQQAVVANFRENLSREDLDIVQEARAIAKLKKQGWDNKLLEIKLGLSRSWFTVREKLMTLPPEIQEDVRAGLINQNYVLKIARLRTKDEQYEAARKIKHAKAMGQAAPKVGNAKRDVTRPAVRGKGEIADAIQWCLYNPQIGEGPHTYFLAWASGEMSDMDLMLALRRHYGDDFKIPEGYQIPDNKLEIRPGERV